MGNRFYAPGLAVGPDGSIYAAFRQGPNRYWLKKYSVVEGQLKELSTVAPSYMDQWPNFFPANVPMTEGPDGEIWFGTAHTHWRVLSLAPRTDKVQERIQGSSSPLCVAFDAENNAYVGGFPHHSDKGPKIYVYPQLGKGGEPKVYPAGNVLYEGKGVPIWDLLPDDDGGVFVRVVEEGYQKGWPAFTIKKVYLDGKMEKFYDFGPAYAKRTKFHPAAACYSLQFDGKGHVILASIPTVSVIKLAKNGELIWEAGQKASGGADMVEFKAPRDTAVDSKGNIWAVDSETNKIYCLSPSGKLLFEYGGYAGVDDVEGKGFHSPTGIAIATVDEKEYLYVGDSGNLRIVKFRIAWK
jgi:outer membrane protein assembly factor BamB